MIDPKACPQLEKLVARHNELRRAEEWGRALAEKMFADVEARFGRVDSDRLAKTFEPPAPSLLPPPDRAKRSSPDTIDAAFFNDPLLGLQKRLLG